MVWALMTKPGWGAKQWNPQTSEEEEDITAIDSEMDDNTPRQLTFDSEKGKSISNNLSKRGRAASDTGDPQFRSTHPLN